LIYFLRHGDAEKNAEEDGESARRLTPKGERRATIVGEVGLVTASRSSTARR
jgi:phosphohistidine phosphatase SixA